MGAKQLIYDDEAENMDEYRYSEDEEHDDYYHSSQNDGEEECEWMRDKINRGALTGGLLKMSS